MDFFTATSDANAQHYDGHITTPGHAAPTMAAAAIARTPAAAIEPVDAFAEAITARYSRTSTLLIPLSPNQNPHASAMLTLAMPTNSLPPLALPTPTLPAPSTSPSMTLPSLPHRPPLPQPPLPQLSLRHPPPPSLGLPARQPHPQPSSSPSQAPAPAAASSFTPVLPSTLAPFLTDPQTLVLDIRNHNAYALARLPTALSLSVPSTLLKRPLFSIAKLAQMLASPAARARFSAYASFARVLVYDAESAVLSEGGNLLGLMRKLRKEGYAGDVVWLKGGFHAVWKERLDLVDREPPPEEEDEDDAQASNAADAPPSAPAAAAGPILRTKGLSMKAFTSSSTTSRALRLPSTSAVPPTPLGLPARPISQFPPGVRTLSVPGASLPTPGAMALQGRHHSVPGSRLSHVPFNPFFDNIRQNMELSAAAGRSYPPGAGVGAAAGTKAAGEEWIVMRLPKRVRRRVGELPFEWLRAIARGCAAGSESEREARDGDEDGDGGDDQEEKQDGDKFAETETEKEKEEKEEEKAGEDLAKALALQFYRIELGEQRRLMGVMAHHSMESGVHESRGEERTLTAAMTTEEGSRRDGSCASVPFPAPGAGAGAGAVHAGSMYASSSAGATYASSTASEDVPASSALSTSAGSSSDAAPAKKKRDKTRAKERVFPFSITAGVEKGDKNRYRNIWPFEHARVRLAGKEDDYMNASYVQPLGTTKRYIATQGPLEATYADFWTLVWEQNVHVIVMLTREVESAQVKCGNYWSETAYGPLRLRLLSTSDTPERERRRREKEMTGFFRASAGGDGDDADGEPADHTVRRVFELRHAGFPRAPPRVVAQLQYLAWPDLDVPRDPRGLLRLLREVEDAAEAARVRTGGAGRVWGEGPLRASPTPTPGPRAEDDDDDDEDEEDEETDDSDAVDAATGVARRARAHAPVLLHCSAGVGRTGGFIAVDAVLDGVRREMRKRRESARAGVPGAPRVGVAATESAGASFTAAESAGFTVPSTSASASVSPASEETDAMEVDSRGSPPRSASVSVSPPVEEKGREREQEREKEEMDVDRSGASSPGVVVAIAPRITGAPTGITSVPAGITSAAAGITSTTTGITSTPAGIASTQTVLTAPVSVGRREVHVPVAGFRFARESSGSAMDVDTSGEEADRSRSVSTQPEGRGVGRARSGTTTAASAAAALGLAAATTTTATAPVTTAPMQAPITTAPMTMSPMTMPTATTAAPSATATATTTTKPSAAFVNEVRRMGAARVPLLAPHAVLAGSGKSTPSASSAPSTSSVPLTSSAPSTSSASTSVSALSSFSSSRSSPASSSTSQATGPTKRKGGLDAWREGVADTGGRAGSQAPPAEPAPEEHANEHCAPPRKLHRDASPPLLSTYAEPILRVVEDMREQRMSLCQSLRQYVFVHRAIVEGALMIVDAEREREREEGARGAGVQLADGDAAALETQNSQKQNAQKLTLPIPAPTHTHIDMPFAFGGLAVAQGSSAPLGAAFVLKEEAHAPPRNLKDVALAEGGAALASPSPRAKRHASPTELLQESPSGDPRLSKRPSVKRKQRSSDEEEAAGTGTDKSSDREKSREKELGVGVEREREQEKRGARFEAMVLSSPSPAPSPQAS